MTLDLDPSSPVPLYQQIVDHVIRLVAVGALRTGDRLPPVREIAVQARVNRNTAARAIQVLEGRGLVRTRVGQGTFVAERSERERDEAAGRALDPVLDRLVAEAAALGLPLRDLVRRLEARIGAFGGDGAGKAGEGRPPGRKGRNR